ncbi:Dehydrogenase (flavoprotein) [Singulisphaera sp. GP187]|uniref:NAD(P)/FAD-dependent oxidoreductase n=1 Tax=Singulisphaera sp. GP187 TaxID=1882752 RepID=UPI0009262C44|nr:FAD-dependent oxidoreductase [Singulisphaera sp. GP187]SIO41948.1 Dehydrogenase (flavoprotein) [Singulisphaera sp. GP187]
MLVNASIVVIGGGPAGGAAALELAQAGCDVVLLEKQPVLGWKIGETLPPEARLHLQRLGHWERFQPERHLPCHGVVSVWGHAAPVEKDFIFNPHGHGWQLDRAQFESGFLNAAVEAGCKVRLDVAVERIERQAAAWTVHTSTGSLLADVLVDCTGRRGTLIRREGGHYEQVDRLVSIFAIATTSQASDFDSRTYVESHPDGWCYTALMPNGTRTVAFQTDVDLVPEGAPTTAWFWERVRACHEICRLLNTHAYQLLDAPRMVAAHSGRFQHCAGPNWIAVGDAAMTFDPLSGQGSAKALESARLAVQAILHQGDYRTACEQLWLNFLRERRDTYRAELRWRDTPFWSRRHAA